MSLVVYIMRHAEADSGERLDPTRGLTDIGKRQAVMMGKWLARQTVQPDLVLHSNMKRSRATAKRVAKQLDVEPVLASGGLLDPDAKPDQAWEEIIRAGNEAGAACVIAVTHGPLVEELIGMATGANPAQIHFAHAAVAHIDPETDKLHWIVTPNTVARDKDEADVVTSDAQSAELTEGARQLEAVLMEGFDSVEQWLRYNESLRHPKHAAALDPLRAKAAGILKRRWDKQGARLVKASGKWLRTMAGQLKEAYTPAERRHMQQTVTAHVNATGVLDADPDERDIARFDAVVTGGMEAGIARMEADHAIALAKDKGERAIAQYLKEQGFAKLAKDIDATSKERIVNALVDAFDGGGTYTDAVAAIRGAYSDMKESRADMIARTELNGAYNDAMLTSAREVAGAMKTWDPDGEACEEICTPNVDQGAIPVEADFESGDDAPPGHPHCDCSLGFEFPSGVEEARRGPARDSLIHV